MEQELLELVKMVKEMSPQIWDAAMGRVYVSLIYNAFWLAFSSVVFISCTYGVWRICRLESEAFDEYVNEDVGGFVLTVELVAIIVSFLLIGATSYNVLLYWLSPEWAAIQNIMELVN